MAGRERLLWCSLAHFHALRQGSAQLTVGMYMYISGPGPDTNYAACPVVVMALERWKRSSSWSRPARVSCWSCKEHVQGQIDSVRILQGAEHILVPSGNRRSETGFHLRSRQLQRTTHTHTHTHTRLAQGFRMPTNGMRRMGDCLTIANFRSTALRLLCPYAVGVWVPCWDMPVPSCGRPEKRDQLANRPSISIQALHGETSLTCICHNASHISLPCLSHSFEAWAPHATGDEYT